MSQVLATAGLFIALISLLFALQCWIANSYRPDRALRLLAYSTIAAAFGLPLVLMRPIVPEVVALPVGNALYFVAISLSWLAAACTFGRKRSPFWLLAAPSLWLPLCLLPRFLFPQDMQIIVEMVLATTLVVLAVYELLREPVQTSSHRALLVLGPFHILCSISSAVCILSPGLILWPSLTTVAMPLEMLTYIVLWPGLSLTLIAERAILRERTRAEHDELSGVLNRSGFWTAAGTMPHRTVLLFDIDHFKRINDSMGHAMGDAVIRCFANIATTVLGDATVFGRVGGEEFAAALNRVSILEAREYADRVRLAFAGGVADLMADTTVSVGISADAACECLNDQMALADRALYRAKRLGRNRVEVHVGGFSKRELTLDQKLSIARGSSASGV